MKKLIEYNQEIKRFNSYNEFPKKIDVPSFQRDLQPHHIKEMREHIKQRYERNKEPIFGALDIAKYDNTYYIIDGNHRLNAIKEEYEKNKIIVPFNCVIYSVSSHQELLEIFQSRNKGLPVPEFILKPDNGNKKLLNEIQNYLPTVSNLFNSNTNRPHVNLTFFINKLAESKIFDSGLIKSLDDFKKILDMMNRIAYQDSKTIKDLASSTIEKCKKSNCYIGIYKQMPWFNDNYDLTEFKNSVSYTNKEKESTYKDYYSDFEYNNGTRKE